MSHPGSHLGILKLIIFSACSWANPWSPWLTLNPRKQNRSRMIHPTDDPRSSGCQKWGNSNRKCDQLHLLVCGCNPPFTRWPLACVCGVIDICHCHNTTDTTDPPPDSSPQWNISLCPMAVIKCRGGAVFCALHFVSEREYLYLWRQGNILQLHWCHLNVS